VSAVERWITFRNLKVASFTHSAIYLGLLTAWLVPGLEGATAVLGWAHGVGWILMCLAVLTGVRLRTIPFGLATLVAVVGGVGPFAGTAGFVWEQRRRDRRADAAGGAVPEPAAAAR
jgi:hypothetical protein